MGKVQRLKETGLSSLINYIDSSRYSLLQPEMVLQGRTCKNDDPKWKYLGEFGIKVPVL